MTRGKVGHYWQRISTIPLTPESHVLLGNPSANGGLGSALSFAVPDRAVSVEAWAVSAGGNMISGGIAYKQWQASQGATITYRVGASGNPTTVTFGGVTVSAENFQQSNADQSISGNSGLTTTEDGFLVYYGGALAGGSSPASPCKRRQAADFFGLLAAVSLAGLSASEDCSAQAAFGSGGFYGPSQQSSPGIGGGAKTDFGQAAGPGAVVLYFA